MDREQLQIEIERLSKPPLLKLEQVSRYSEWLDRRWKLRQPGRVVGDTGVGKTSASRLYAFQHRASKQPNHVPKISVLYVEIASSACGSALLFELIIDAVKQKAKSGKVTQLRNQAWHYLKQTQVELLIIDEAHNLQYKSLTDIRMLQQEAGVIPILIGTSSRLDTLLSKDEQIASRFANHFSFEILTGGNFKKTIAIWEREVLKLPEPSNLAQNTEIVTLLQSKTGGQVRLLDQILRDAAVAALETGHTRIDRGILDSIEGDYALLAS